MRMSVKTTRSAFGLRMTSTSMIRACAHYASLSDSLRGNETPEYGGGVARYDVGESGSVAYFFSSKEPKLVVVVDDNGELGVDCAMKVGSEGGVTTLGDPL